MGFQFNGKIKGASEFTKKMTYEFAKEFAINLSDPTNSEYESAKKGLVRSAEEFEFLKEDETFLKSLERWKFFDETEVPETVHPSLWINGKGNIITGLFEVLPNKIYQARGLDIANITFVRSKTGWIVFDTGTTALASSIAVKMMEEYLGEAVRETIRAVIISHSHADHFGGIRGVVDEERVGTGEGQIPIYVPAGFDEETIRENVYVGAAMHHRADYQIGSSLIPGPTGKITNGLGTGIIYGRPTYIRPTHHITEDTSLVIDGLDVEFQLTPGTEAPAEMNNYIPEYKAFWAAENCTGTLHNFYPIRGAQVRNALNWWKFTEVAAEKYGKKAEIVFQSHNWAHFNTEEAPNTVEDFLRNNAAIYKTIHDQTLRYANAGYTSAEIAQKIRIPEQLKKTWYIRPYYGSYEVNARAVYNKYLGFYNGNPVNLDPLPEREEAVKFVEYAGGAEKVLERAKADFDKGDYRWAAKAANYVVYTDPNNMDARYLCADAFEQLGYQSESSIWRNAYLVGARELREGKPKVVNIQEQEVRNDLVLNMTTDMILDYIGLSVDSEKLGGENLRFRLQITDRQNPATVKETFIVHIYSGVVLYYGNDLDEELPYVRLPEGTLLALLKHRLNDIKPLIQTDAIAVLEKLQDAITDVDGATNFSLVGLQ